MLCDVFFFFFLAYWTPVFICAVVFENYFNKLIFNYIQQHFDGCICTIERTNFFNSINSGQQVPVKACGDSWMSPINRQFSNMGLLVSHCLSVFSSVVMLKPFSSLSCQLVHANGGFPSMQGDDPPGPNIDMDKKMDVDKRCMGFNDYNSDMRKGVRGGGMNAYRPGASKEMAPGDSSSYYDKVPPRRLSTILCVSHLFCRFHLVFSYCSLFPPVVFPPLLFDFSSPLPTTTD